MKPFCQANSPADADLNEIVYQYNSCLHNILDNHAPLKSHTITIGPCNPWYSPEIDEAKKLRKQLERKWRKTKLDVDREIFTTQRQLVYSMIYEAKTAYYRDKYQTVIIIHRLRSRRPQCFSMHDDHQQMRQSAVLALLLHYPQAIFVHN